MTLHDVVLALIVGGYVGWILPDRRIKSKKSLDNHQQKG